MIYIYIYIFITGIYTICTYTHTELYIYIYIHMCRPPGSPSPANALLDSALQPCKFLWVIAICTVCLHGSWNMLVCTLAKLGGPYSVQAAYEELLLIALVHLLLTV